MRGAIILGVLLLTLASVTALTGPFTQNGKDYYVVNSADPSEDTGDEVCAKIGQICVGYTHPGNEVCLQAHPGAATQSGLSGDVSGVYCNGAPQTGLCGGLTNTCSTCPACSVSVQCNQPIGGLYREMYVECKAAPTTTCPQPMFARDTNAFFNEIPQINTGLQNCPVQLPAQAARLIKGNTHVEVTMNNGIVRSVYLTIQNNQITGIRTGAGNCRHKVTLTQTTLDAILGARDRGAAALTAYTTKKVRMTGCNFIGRFTSFFVQPVVRFVARRAVPPPPPPVAQPNCGQVGEQCNNRACHSGICAAPREYINGRWQSVNYRCLDQAGYNSYCIASGNTPAPWTCLTGPCR